MSVYVSVCVSDCTCAICISVCVCERRVCVYMVGCIHTISKLRGIKIRSDDQGFTLWGRGGQRIPIRKFPHKIHSPTQNWKLSPPYNFTISLTVGEKRRKLQFFYTFPESFFNVQSVYRRIQEFSEILY